MAVMTMAAMLPAYVVHALGCITWAVGEVGVNPDRKLRSDRLIGGDYYTLFCGQCLRLERTVAQLHESVAGLSQLQVCNLPSDQDYDQAPGK